MARVYEANAVVRRGGPGRAAGTWPGALGLAVVVGGLAGCGSACLGGCARSPEPLRGPETSAARATDAGAADAAAGASVGASTSDGVARTLTPQMLYSPGEVLLREVRTGGANLWACERRTTSARDADGRWTLRFERRATEEGAWVLVRELGLGAGADGGVEMSTLRDAERETLLTFVPPIEIFPVMLAPGAVATSAAKVESVEVGSDGRAKQSITRGEATHRVEHLAGGAGGVDGVLATLRLELSGAVVTRERRSSYGAAGLVHERERLTVKVGPFTIEKRERAVER